MTTAPDLAARREAARALLNEFDTADALTAYYALHHDPRRTDLFLHYDALAGVDGFLVRCQTGFDLFRPLITLRARDDDALADLLADGMIPARPYILVAPPDLVERVEHLAFEGGPRVELTQKSVNRVLRLEPAHFEPEINVLVERKDGPGGDLRCEIRRLDGTAALAGVNWRSPMFAEIFVQVKAAHRGRGWGRAVVSCVVAELLRQGVMPIYMVDERNAASRELAARVGFVDTGAREVMTEAVLVD
jgi:GNAT superfamily N-acetyltransferase